MTALSDELRLLIFVAVQSFVLFAAWRASRRWTTAGRLQRLMDTLLVTYVIQYLAVGLPGMAGLLSPISMLLTATLLAGGVWWLGGANDRSTTSTVSPPASFFRHPSTLPLIGFFFVTGYAMAYAWTQRVLPPMGTDALTYHFPAAVQWLQHGRVDLYQTWFFNPANTYSPLAGSMFYAWLLGPIGNDTLAVWAPAPMIPLLFLAVVAIARSMNASNLVAVLVAAGFCLSRPIVNQIDKGKDDLFLAAFFAITIAAMSRQRLRDPIGPWRLGMSLGLFLATKYTALLALPMLLLWIDTPFRAGWKPRQWLSMVGCTVAIALPWYLRNYLVTGNPLFPTDFLFFDGLFSTARSEELRSFRRLLGVLVSGNFGIPEALGIVILAGWLIALLPLPRGTKRNARLVFAPLVGVAVFVVVSPYPEVRFLVPALMLACLAVTQTPRWGWVLAVLLAISAIATGINWNLVDLLITFLVSGAIFASVGIGLMYLQARVLRLECKSLAVIAGGGGVILAGAAFVYWHAFVENRRDVAREAFGLDRRGAVWNVVRDELPPNGIIAYAGTHTVYPLMGYDLHRPLIYVPVRKNVTTLAELPRLGDKRSGEQINVLAASAAVAEADRETWLANLRRSGATHLVILADLPPTMPEQVWAKSMPQSFLSIYVDDAGEVFWIQ